MGSTTIASRSLRAGMLLTLGTFVALASTALPLVHALLEALVHLP